MVNAATSPSPTNHTESSATDAFNDGNDFSAAVRVFNGTFIALLFTTGLWANILVLHVLRKSRILQKNTSVILANIMITDLLCALTVLPYDFIRFALDLSLSQDNSIFKTITAFKNGLAFLNCGLTITLTVERTKTATYFGRRRGDHLSRPLTLCLGVIWLSSMGEAVITYATVNSSNTLPWKRPGKSSGTLSAGDTIFIVIVLTTYLVILISLYLITSFLRRLNAETEKMFREVSKRKKMPKRIAVAWVSSLIVLIVSYLPIITVRLTWYSLGRQNSNANAIVHVLYSLTHTINPVIAIAMSTRMQRAFMRVVRFVEPFKTLSKRFPSFYGSRTSLSGKSILSGNEIAFGGSLKMSRMPPENNIDNTKCNWTVHIADETGFDGNTAVIHVITENCGNEPLNNYVEQVEKKPLTRQRSLSDRGRLTVPRESEGLLGKPAFWNRSDTKIHKTTDENT